MKSEVSVTFKDAAPVVISLDKEAPAAPDVARGWLDEQFTRLACEPLRPTGKALLADKVLLVAQAAGPALFADAGWAREFARCTSAALGKPVVHVDLPALTVGY